MRGLEEALLEEEGTLHAAAAALAELDAALALASVAADFGFVRPEVKISYFVFPPPLPLNVARNELVPTMAVKMKIRRRHARHSSTVERLSGSPMEFPLGFKCARCQMIPSMSTRRAELPADFGCSRQNGR